MKLDKKWITNKQLEDLQCQFGSFTCGLITTLKKKSRCNSCKKLEKRKIAESTRFLWE